MINKIMGLKVLILPVALAAAVFLFIFMIQPEYKRMNESKKVVQQKESELAELQKQTAKLTELKQAFESSAEEEKTVKTALPENEATEMYLAELYQRAVRSGILMSTFSAAEASGGTTNICGVYGGASAASSGETVSGTAESSAVAPNASSSLDSGLGGPTAAASCVKKMDFGIGVKGNWDQLLNFFKYLADSNRIANINEVALIPFSESVAQGQPESDLINADISLSVYYKSKDPAGNVSTLNALANGSSLNTEMIEKIKDTIYLPYESSPVTETGERNFFK